MLTLYGVISSELHVDVVPFQETAFSRERLGIYDILIIPKCKGLHRYGLKNKGFLQSKLCNKQTKIKPFSPISIA